MMKGAIALGALTALTVAVGPALAHGTWVDERFGQLAIIYGHGADDDAYDPAKIVSVEAVDASGDAVTMDVVPAETHAMLETDGEPAAVAVVFDNGYWSQDAEAEWFNVAMTELDGAVSGGQYIKNSLSLFSLDGEVPPLPEQTLQIVPLSDPSGLAAGETLRVRVLYEGEPLSGAAVFLDYVNAPDAESDPTDASGEVDLPVRNDGLNVLAVDHRIEREDDPRAEETVYTATLTFVTGEYSE